MLLAAAGFDEIEVSEAELDALTLSLAASVVIFAGAVTLLVLVWFAFQILIWGRRYSLRTLLVFMLAVAVGMSAILYGDELNQRADRMMVEVYRMRMEAEP